MALVLLVFLASILLVVLTARTFYLASKFRDLDDRVRMLERQEHGTIPASTPVVAPSLTAAPSAVASSVPATVTSAGSMRIVPEAPAAVVPPAAPPEPPPPSRTREEWEALIGGRLLNRIGALALIIGVGFFLKYAIDNQWISELTRVLIGVGVGLLCLVGADRTRKKGFQIFSQGLVGAGIAILYLSVYASFNFYSLISLPVAFVFMGAVTVIAFLEALRNDSLAVSLLACVGGFLTPFILSTGESNEVGLFAYLIALDLGVIFILLRRSTWAALEPLSLVGTYAIYFSWFGAYYTTAHTLPALFFLGLFWAIYHGLDLFRAMTAQDLYADIRRAMAWLHAALSFGALYAIVIPHGSSQTALAATIAVVFYVGSALFLERRMSGSKAAVIQYTLTGCTFLVWAIALQFERFTIVMFWTIEALLMVWMGTRYKRRYLWGAGLALFGITALALLGEDGSLAVVSFEGYRTILNPRALSYVLLAVAVGVSAHFIRPALNAGSTVLSEVLNYGWILLLFIVLTVETNDLFRFWMIGATDSIVQALGFTRLMVLAGVWALSGLVLVWVAERVDIRPVLFSGIACAALAACLAGIRGIAFDPLTAFTSIFNIRVYAILIIAVIMFLEVRWLRKSAVQSSWIPELREALLILGVGLLLVLLTGEIRDMFERGISVAGGSDVQGQYGEVARLENLEQLSLSGVWLLFSIGVMTFGIWRRTRILRYMAIVLFGLTILKIFVYDLSFLETLYRIFSFIALGLILLAVSYLYQRYRSIILGPSEIERA